MSPAPRLSQSRKGGTGTGPLYLQSSTTYAVREKQPAAGGGTDDEVQIVDMHPADEYALVLGLHGTVEGTFDVPILETSWR